MYGRSLLMKSLYIYCIHFNITLLYFIGLSRRGHSFYPVVKYLISVTRMALVNLVSTTIGGGVVSEKIFYYKEKTLIFIFYNYFIIIQLFDNLRKDR
jgi:hypothetical protein